MNDPTSDRLTLHLTPAAARAVRKGHPWIYDRSLTKQSADGPAGSLAVLFDDRKRFVGLGLYDPESPLRVRVLHRGKPTPIDDAWFVSLRYVCRRILAADPIDPAVVEDDLSRQIVTAFLTSHRKMRGEADRWLAALEEHRPGNVAEYADQLAWISYQGGDMDAAKRWVDLSDPETNYARTLGE